MFTALKLKGFILTEGWNIGFENKIHEPLGGCEKLINEMLCTTLQFYIV